MACFSDRFLEDWRQIKSLRLLDPDSLHVFWQQVDEFTGMFDDMLHRNTPVNDLLQSIVDPFGELLRLGDYIRARHIMREIFERSDQRKNGMVRMKAAIQMGFIQFSLSDFSGAETCFQTGMTMLGDSPVHEIRKAVQLSNLGMVAGYRRELDRAVSYTQDSIRRLNKLGQTFGIPEFNRLASESGSPDFSSQRSTIHSNMGSLLHAQAIESPPGPVRDRLWRQAVRHHIRSIQAARTPDSRLRSRANLAISLIYSGCLREGDSILQRLESVCRTNGNDRILSWIIGFRADSAMLQNRPDEALKLCHQSLKYAIQAADPVCEGQSIQFAISPLKQICHKTFGGSISSATFRNAGFPIIQQILNFLEDKDWYTGRDHSVGVGRIAVSLFELHQETNGCIPGYDCATVQFAALLHDIGKLWIPWTILNRTTPLWPEEFEIIRSHPGRGREFLAELGFPTIGEILGRHHERPDGLGYPHGGDIGGPVERILAIADCYEAMTTPNRRYRDPMSRETAVRNIQALGGKQFDAEIVRMLPFALT